MNMRDHMKRIIALCTVIAWVLLFGFSFSEVLETFNDKLENSEELVERALSLPTEKNIFIWDEFPEMPKSSELMTIAVVNDLQTSISLHDSVSLQHYASPSRPKLFKFLSTYRL